MPYMDHMGMFQTNSINGLMVSENTRLNYSEFKFYPVTPHFHDICACTLCNHATLKTGNHAFVLFVSGSVFKGFDQRRLGLYCLLPYKIYNICTHTHIYIYIYA